VKTTQLVRIASIKSLPSAPRTCDDSAAVVPCLRRNSMAYEIRANLASTNEPIRPVFLGSTTGQVAQFVQLATDTIAHHQIRFQKGLVTGQQIAALTGLGIFQCGQQIVRAVQYKVDMLRVSADTSIC